MNVCCCSNPTCLLYGCQNAAKIAPPPFAPPLDTRWPFPNPVRKSGEVPAEDDGRTRALDAFDEAAIRRIVRDELRKMFAGD
jgi:hypothetical protein